MERKIQGDQNSITKTWTITLGQLIQIIEENGGSFILIKKVFSVLIIHEINDTESCLNTVERNLGLMIFIGKIQKCRHEERTLLETGIQMPDVLMIHPIKGSESQTAENIRILRGYGKTKGIKIVVLVEKRGALKRIDGADITIEAPFTKERLEKELRKILNVKE